MNYEAKNTISLTEARRRIFDLAEGVQKPGTFYSLTEKGRAKAVMLSADEFTSLMETVDTLDYFPEVEKDVEKGEREIASGNVYSLEDVLAEEGFVAADKPRSKENVQRKANKNRKKGSKRS